MNGIFGLVASLLMLAIPVGVIALVVGGLNRVWSEDPEPDDPGIGTVKRLFLYLLALVSLGLAATGLALLLGGLLDALFADLVIAERDTELATALALTVVGLPAWLIFALMAQRTVQAHPVELRAMSRWLYLVLVRSVALSVAAGFAVMVGRFLVGADDFDGGDWGWLIVSSATWFGHQVGVAGRTPAAAGPRFLDRVYRAYGSALGLAVLGLGLIMVVVESGLRVYDGLFRSLLVEDDWTVTLRWGAVQVVVGGAVWWWHWLRRLRFESATTTWRVVVFLVGVLAGLTVAISSAAVLLYVILEWVLRVPDAKDTVEHFAGTVPAAGFMLIGAASWAYHRAVLRERAPLTGLRRSGPERIYRYLVAAAGLITLAGGLTSVVALSLDALLPADGFVREGEWWRNDLALTLTFLLVGAPLWGWYWLAAQRIAEQEGSGERQALSRRVFLFAVFGSAILVVLVNLSILLFEVFDAMLEGSLGAQTLRDVRWSAGLIASAGAVSTYYWLILRADQSVRPESEPGPPPAAVREVVLVAPPEVGRVLGEALAARGLRVRRWDRADGHEAVTLAPAVDAITAQVDAVGTKSVVVVVDPEGGFRVVPASAV